MRAVTRGRVNVRAIGRVVRGPTCACPRVVRARGLAPLSVGGERERGEVKIRRSVNQSGEWSPVNVGVSPLRS